MNNGTVHLFVFDTMADWEAAFAIACINNPQFQLAPGRYHVTTVGASKEMVTTIGGVRIQPEGLLADVSPNASAMLILPGGQSWESGSNTEAVKKAQDFVAAGVPVAAICAATLALARAGLLDDREHTSNAPEYLTASGYRGGGFYRHASAITDRNVITAAGIAPVDFAYQIFKTLNLYGDMALQAWYALFKNGDASKYHRLVKASTGSKEV
jgi:putative intracellular protease/amidase